MELKILLHSNAPWCHTGYGYQTRLFTKRWKETLGLDVSVSACFGLQGGAIRWNDMVVLPGGKTLYGGDVVGMHARTTQADVTITLLDAWVFNKEIFTTPWIAWFPVDCEPLAPNVGKAIKGAWKRITISRFGQRIVENAGLESTYIPHGVDTELYKPMDKQEIRKLMKVPESAYVVGIIGANKDYPARKALVEQIEAFAKFKRKHQDAILHLHTDPRHPNGVDLVSACEFFGLAPGMDVFYPHPYEEWMGYPDDVMSRFYNFMDVTMLVSSGEGFGIPLIESQACGVPVITGDWTATGELCGSGWKVDKSEAYPFYSNQDAFFYRPKVDAIVEKLNMAYEMRGNAEYSKRARDFAMQYSADKITEKYWKPFFEQTAVDLEVYKNDLKKEAVKS